MRIIAGTHRGTQLADVGTGDAASHLRPTPDRVRESLFNMLQGGRYGDPIRDAVALDLFAGTGALGLEALSRGARRVTFVENGTVGARLIQDNVAKLKRRGDTSILRVDATRIGFANNDGVASLVFLDPPYGKGLGRPALESCMKMGWIAPAALIVWEDSSPQPPPPGYTLHEHRRYGSTHITLLGAP